MSEQNQKNKQDADASTVNAIVMRWKKHARGLDREVKKLSKIYPKAEMYLANDSLHLMSGPHHEMEGTSCIPKHERSIASIRINADGGDW